MKNLIATIVACLSAGFLLSLGLSSELPVGGLSGTVTMAENGRPLPKVLVVISPVSKDDEFDFHYHNYNVETDAAGHYQLSHIPSGDYHVEVVAQQHSLRSRSIIVPEGGVVAGDLKLQPNPQSLELDASQKVLAPKTEDSVELRGFTPAIDFKLEVRKLKLDSVQASGGVSQALEPVARQRKGFDQEKLTSISDQVWSGDTTISKKNVEGSFVQNVKIPGLDEGLYFVAASGGGLSASVFLNVTHIAMVTKSVDKQSLCFVTDIDTGKPIPDTPLGIFKEGAGFQKLASTDGSGLATVRQDPKAPPAMIVAELGNSVAVSGTSLSADADSGNIDPNIRIFSYADRPVYRPGDLIQFKAIVRRIAGDELVLPGPGTAQIQVMDEQENLLQSFNVPVSAHGTLHGGFTTSSEAKPGVYQIRIKAFRGETIYYANLAAYRKPDYSVKVTAAHPRYVLGDTAQAVVECQYYFGGPVAGAKVKASIYRSERWTFDSDDDDTTEGDSNDFQGGDIVQEVEATTDGLGKATIEFPTKAKDDDDSDTFSDYNYRIEATVEGAGNHSFEGSTSVVVTRGAYQLSVGADPNFLAVNQAGKLSIHASSFDANPKPIAGQAVKIEIGTEVYTAHTVVYQPLQTLSATTDSNGVATVPITPTKAGNIKVKATSQDSQGREIEAASYIYVEGSASLIDPDSPTMEVKLDHKKYSVGDLAKVLLTTNNPGGVALVTVESDSIKKVMTTPIESGSTLVTIPVDKTMAPNAFVTVAYVHHRHYLETQKGLVVSRKEKALTVQITPDKPQAAPGTEVRFQIKTLGADGVGTPANVSLGVVDESIYAIKKDTTDIKSSLYPRKDDLVQTNFSFPEIYLDGGDKAGGSVPIRSKFLDTAAWIPEVETDSHGNASVKVKIPDNLTSWRATSVAATDGSAVGMASSNVIASKPLMVRIVGPQFLVAQDRQSLSADITNASSEPLTVNVNVACTNLVLEESPKQPITLQPGSTYDAPITISAVNSGDAKITATVTSDKGLNDGVESKFSVEPHARLVEDEQSGLVEKSKTFTFNLLERRDPKAGRLNVVVSPSIASGLVQSLDQLILFPYGCVEQTMSRFLPAIRVATTIKNTPLRRADLEAKADKISKDGFARLQKMQHSDGGWGWWTYDDSEPFMTAWVLDGFQVAKKCGKNPPSSIDVAKALKWAEARLKTPFKTDSTSERLYLLLALAENGVKSDPSLLKSLDLGKARVGELALTGLGANELGDPTLRDQCLDRIGEIVKSGDSISRRQPHDWSYWWSEDEEIALALRAFTAIRPNDPLVPTIALRLDSMKRSDGWASTRATTMATLAMCNYIDSHPQSIGKSQVKVSLNGALLKTVNIDPSKADIADLRMTIPMSQLKDGANQLTVEDATGAPYVAAGLRQYDVSTSLTTSPGNKSMVVWRTYYKMETTKMDDGTLKFLPAKKPTTTFSPGDVIRCQVVVHCDHPVDYLLVEDPIPSNCRVTDREDPQDGDTWSSWWSDLTIMDDRVALFAREMPAGSNVLTYTMRAEGVGTSVALPTHAANMYAPDMAASGPESTVMVKE